VNHVAHPEWWGLHALPGGELALGNHGLCGLARKYGTPVHILNEKKLMEDAAAFHEEAAACYPGRVSVYYAMKCNSVPAVVGAILRSGLSLEVMTPCELALALKLGCPAGSIVVNGPCKTDEFLAACVEAGVRFVIIDAIEELQIVDRIARMRGTTADVLLRVNPDFTPHGVSTGSATGSRKGCAFGLDLKGGQVTRALHLLPGLPGTRFRGFHMHIGTGIRRAADYGRALRCLESLDRASGEAGYRIEVLDVGGGFAARNTWEMAPGEMLLYQAFGRLAHQGRQKRCSPRAAYFSSLGRSLTEYFAGRPLPELLFEPGRCIASAAQMLLLTIHRVKDRPGAGRWLIADGGLSTVTLPTFYEYHEILLCNDVFRPQMSRATIIGPACFAGDIIYRNKRIPEVHRGEVIAVMDSGAYFTALESSFGFPRPPVVTVNGATCKLVRTRETFDEMVGRDLFD
jgi:diaminopimelate decarboxylase